MDAQLIINRWAKVLASNLNLETKEVHTWIDAVKVSELELSRFYLGIRFNRVEIETARSTVLNLTQVQEL